MRPRSLLALVLVAVYSPLAAENPSPPAPQTADPFRALAEIKTRDDIWERSFDSLYEQMRAAFWVDPTLGPADQRCPGLIDAVAAAARPIMREGHYRQRVVFRDGLTRLFAEGLSANEAREAYAFYASDDGRYLLELGTDSSSQLAKIAKGSEPIDKATFDDDLDRTHEAISRNVDPEAERRAEAALEASRWYRPYLKLHPRIQQLRFDISRDKTIIPPGEQDYLPLAVRRATALHLAQCQAAMSQAP